MAGINSIILKSINFRYGSPGERYIYIYIVVVRFVINWNPGLAACNAMPNVWGWNEVSAYSETLFQIPNSGYIIIRAPLGKIKSNTSYWFNFTSVHVSMSMKHNGTLSELQSYGIHRQYAIWIWSTEQLNKILRFGSAPLYGVMWNWQLFN